MKRRKAREYTVQILYMLDAGGLNAKSESFPNPGELIRFFTQYYAEKDAKAELKEDEEFWQKLLATCLREFKQIDELIESQSEHWKLNRMPRVDRSILRMAVGELLGFSDIAANVTIDEALEIAKRFGTEESAPFINGILDSLWKKLSPQLSKPIA